MYGENGESWTVETIVILIIMFTVLGGWEPIVRWVSKIRNKTPNVARKAVYIVFLVATFYFLMK